MIKHFVCRGDLAGSWNGWVVAGRAPAPNENDNENDDNEKHGIPDNPPQQRTQGETPHSDNRKISRIIIIGDCDECHHESTDNQVGCSISNITSSNFGSTKFA